MSLRLQKRWSQLGSPQIPGTHNARGIGKIVDITAEQIAQAQQLGDALVVLSHHETPGMTACWEIVQISAD